jgi:hypothetical protein
MCGNLWGNRNWLSTMTRLICFEIAKEKEILEAFFRIVLGYNYDDAIPCYIE